MVPEKIHARPTNVFARPRCLALLLTLIMLAFLPPAARSEDGGRRYALLIGVGSYQQWSPLVNPIPDVRALGEELRHRYGFLTEVLENPSREDVVAKLRRYYHLEYGPKDQLLIVFAGHGSYDEVSRIGYLVASDSENRQRDPNFVTLLSYPWLLTLIDHVDCPNVLLVVDACYSGSLGAGTSAVGNMAGKARKVRRFLTSGGVEYVPDGDPDRHTPFMRQLLAGLRNPGPDGVLTLEELQDRFMSRVDPRPRWGSFGGGGGGHFALVASGSAPPLRQGDALRSASVSRSARPPVPPPSPAVSSRLRSEPKDVSESALERAFSRLEIFDTTRNPEGDFPNQYRIQERGGWEVVVDLESGLAWQRSGSEYRLSLREAVEYVDRLNREGHAGHRDWRLPTLEELASLLEPLRQADDLYVSPRFDTDQESCWSADRDRDGQNHYYVSFNAGRAVLAFGAKTAFVRAVRSE